MPTSFYVVSPGYSGVAAFATEAEATEYAEATAGELIPEAQVSPEVRTWAADMLAERAAVAQ